MTTKKKKGFTLAGTRWLDRYTGSRSALPCRHRKAAFTLAGTPCFDMSKGCRSELLFRHKKAAFTLAEVLITLAIIGVVAAITIPSLMALIGSRSDAARKEVIEDRLLDGLNRYSAMEDGLSLHYNTTKEFLDGLSKYYKMSQICDSDEITRCVPYAKINFEEGEGDAKEIKSVDVSSLTTTAALISGEAAENYLPPASFITAQGTPVIIALKKGCTQDMGKAMTSIQTAGEGGCIALMYDKNGTGLPNRIGKDIVNLGLTVTSAASGDDTPSGSGAALKTINGVKVMEVAFFPSDSGGLSLADCQAETAKQSEYTALGFETGIKSCYYDGNDYWAAAMKYCKEKGYHLPSEEESLKLVQGLYKDASGNHPTGTSGFGSYTIDLEAVSALGLKNYDKSSISTSNVGVYLWLGKEYVSTYAYYRGFHTSNTDVGANDRNVTNRQAVCVGD